jgi:hypothetical protein
MSLENDTAAPRLFLLLGRPPLALPPRARARARRRCLGSRFARVVRDEHADSCRGLEDVVDTDVLEGRALVVGPDAKLLSRPCALQVPTARERIVSLQSDEAGSKMSG